VITCVVFGDRESPDRSKRYVKAVFCESCYRATIAVPGDDPVILFVLSATSDAGVSCSICQRTDPKS